MLLSIFICNFVFSTPLNTVFLYSSMSTRSIKDKDAYIYVHCISL